MTRTRTFAILAIAAAVAAVAGGAALAERHGRGGMEGRGPFQALDFETLDTDGDGRITETEMQARRTARVAALDADNDGRISLDELRAQHLRQAEERADRMARRMMQAMDSDGDNMLTAAELAAGPSMSGMFGRIDADGDGAITRAEAEAAQARMGERMAQRGKGGWHRGHGAPGADSDEN